MSTFTVLDARVQAAIIRSATEIAQSIFKAEG